MQIKEQSNKSNETKGLYKRDRIWWFCFTKDGLQFHRTTKKENFLEALTFKNNFLEQLNNPIKITNRVYLFDTVVLKFLDERERVLKKGTIVLYKMMLRNIVSFFSGKIIDNITKVDIKYYENYRLMNGCSQGFLIKELKLLKNIFNYALENELLSNNLFDRYNFKKIYKDYEPRERFLTPEECQRIIENSNRYLKRLIIFLLETGLRINELTSLLFNDIATEPNTNVQFARIRKEIAKNNKERFIPLSKEAMEQVNQQRLEFPNNTYIFTDAKGNCYKTTPKKALMTAIKKSNLKPCGFHIFRHTFASQKLQGVTYKGEKIRPVRIELISEILGHSSIDLTKKFMLNLIKIL